MALWIQISPGSNQPIYSQIVAQISTSIARKQLSPGDKLPAVRKLAAELVINPNTVARAYSDLEKADLVSTKTGSGTFVTDPNLRNKDASQLNILTERMDNIITFALNIGLEKDYVSDLFKNRLANFANETEKGK